MKKADRGDLDAILDRIVHELGRPVDDLERQIDRYGVVLVNAQPKPRQIGFRAHQQRD